MGGGWTERASARVGMAAAKGVLATISSSSRLLSAVHCCLPGCLMSRRRVGRRVLCSSGVPAWLS